MVPLDGSSASRRGFAGLRHVRRRTSEERGAALVEFALVLPLLVCLVMGAIDIGFLMNDTTKLRAAVREVGRRAAVGGYGDATCALTNPSTVETNRALASQKLMCLGKFFALDAGLDVRSAIRVVAYDDSGARLGGTNQPFADGNAVIFCAQTFSRSRTGFLAPLLNNKVVSSKVTMRIGTTISNGPGESQEASLGGTWALCTDAG